MPPKQQAQIRTEQPSYSGAEISKTEWMLVISALALIDLLEIALDLLAVGLALDTIIDPGVGILFGLYLATRVQTQGLVGWFIGTLAGEAIPGLNALPLWTLDGIMSYLKYKEARLAAQIPGGQVLQKAINKGKSTGKTPPPLPRTPTPPPLPPTKPPMPEPTSVPRTNVVNINSRRQLLEQKKNEEAEMNEEMDKIAA